MNIPKTKLELLQDNQRLGADNFALRKEVGDLRHANKLLAAKVKLLSDQVTTLTRRDLCRAA